MVHKPCGVFNPSFPCMKTNLKTKMKYCQGAYPQPLETRSTSQVSQDEPNTKAQPTVTPRPSSARTAKTRLVTHQSTNRSIVPFNAWLISKFGSYICCDLVTAKAVIAYLYKYAYKKADTIRARIFYGKNEIKAYRSCRYISSPEAMRHIFAFNSQERTAIGSASVHPP